MQIETGLFDHMVLQRDAKGLSDAKITGSASADGTVLATVKRRAKTLKGFDGVEIGRVRGGKLTAMLTGLATGGPYSVVLQIVGRDGIALDKLNVKDVLVGDVWVVAGQSNAQGCGHKSIDPRNPLVRAFYMGDYWGVAVDTIHSMWEAVDAVHKDLTGGVLGAKPDPKKWQGVGPGVPFAQEMLRRGGRPAAPQGLLACAHGGTSMAQWDPALKAQGGKSLYGAMLRRFHKNGGKVAGVIWYQGESDAGVEPAAVYTQKMKTLVAEMRRDFSCPELPVAIVQIGRVVAWGDTKSWNSIQDQQGKLQKLIPRLATVPAIDLPLDDAIHISGAGQHTLGKRLAQAMRAIRGDKGAGPMPIAFKKVSVRPNPRSDLADVVVEFENVAGKLVAAGEPMGFAVTDSGVLTNLYAFACHLDGKTAVVRTGLAPNDVSDPMLHYGLGLTPACNITDELGRSLPVLGPVRLGISQVRTPFVNTALVSPLLPGAGKLDGLSHPGDLSALGLKPREFVGNFMNRHDDWLTAGDKLVYYAIKLRCSEPMRLAAQLGYDGPIKLWVDGRELFHDPNGINPALASAKSVAFDAAAGDHEVLVALGSNEGRAWGLYLRFQRLGVTKEALAKGPEAYVIPQITL